MDGPRARGAGLRLRALAALLLAGVAPAPSSLYDRPGVTHNDQCLATADGRPAVLRALDGEQLQTLFGALTDPLEARETCSSAPGIRFEGIEAVAAGGVPMYYTWPLEDGLQGPGFIAADELAGAPVLVAADGAGNGRPAPPAPGEPAYAITPQDISKEQGYGGPASGRWYTYSVYGRPVGGAEFALMTWSWIDVAGGGIARATVAQGELFRPAAVAPITLASIARQGQVQNGTVTARYGYVEAGGERLYGWMVTSHTFDGRCYDHMAYAGGGEPLAGTLCPEGLLGDVLADGSSLTGPL